MFGEAVREKIKAFLADRSWQFPAARRQKCRELHRIFDPRRILADDPTKLKGSCSEFLGLFSLLRHWVEVEAPTAAELELAKKSFRSLCSILDTILHCKRGLADVASAAPKLAANCSEYLQLHKAS